LKLGKRPGEVVISRLIGKSVGSAGLGLHRVSFAMLGALCPGDLAFGSLKLALSDF
jgi:hypothetical protein